VDFADFVPPENHPFRFAVLEELVRIDLEHHWLKSQPRWLEDYFHRFPELFEISSAVRTLAFEEFRLRRQAGQAVTADEYRHRFGIDPTRGIRDDLPDPLLGAQSPKPQVDRFSRVLAALPRVGDRFLDYRLTAQLGAGAFGQVFLGYSDKSRRPVAIKVAPLIGGEPAMLARLRHPHIVPVRAVHHEGDVQAVVMPYRGAVTLAHVQLHFGSGEIPKTGAALFDVRRPGFPLAAHGGARLRSELSDVRYVDAAVWLIGRLAEGLSHAHERGLLHRDLKPANVLIADNGTPMLLDFNMSADAMLNEPLRRSPGGTVPYMSPEQIDDFLGNRREVDARSDLYGLGVLLYQLLTGHMPFPSPHDLSRERLAATLLVRLRPALPVRSFNPSVSHFLEEIVKKLLQPDPDLRLPTAAALKHELDALVPQLLKRVEYWRDRDAAWKKQHARH
jgi:serine/threonine protein kinase